MTCPQDPFGRPACNLVAHPDRPVAERYCVTCNKRFVSTEDSGWVLQSLGPVFIGLLLLMLYASMRDRPQPGTGGGGSGMPPGMVQPGIGLQQPPVPLLPRPQPPQEMCFHQPTGTWRPARHPQTEADRLSSNCLL